MQKTDEHKKLMRILHVHSGNLYGGVETLLLSLLKFQTICPDFNQEFALCFEGKLSAELKRSKAPLHILHSVRLRDPISVKQARNRLHALLKAETFEVVVVHSSWSNLIFAPVVKKAKIPLVQWVHGARTKSWLERLSAKWKPDLAIFNSYFTSSTFEGVLNQVDQAVVYCPFECPLVSKRNEMRERVRSETNTAVDDVVIVQVGRMEHGKGQEVLLEALAGLPQNSGWTCWMVGAAQRKGELDFERSLRKQAMRIGLVERVRFLGQRDDVESLLCSADIFCQPNTRPEGFGMSLLEALSMSLPAIVTSIGATPEIITSSCGILVPPADSKGLAESVTMMIYDAKARKTLGAKGPARVNELCDPQKQMIRLHQLLCGLIPLS